MAAWQPAAREDARQREEASNGDHQPRVGRFEASLLTCAPVRQSHRSSLHRGAFSNRRGSGTYRATDRTSKPDPEEVCSTSEARDRDVETVIMAAQIFAPMASITSDAVRETQRKDVGTSGLRSNLVS